MPNDAMKGRRGCKAFFLLSACQSKAPGPGAWFLLYHRLDNIVKNQELSISRANFHRSHLYRISEGKRCVPRGRRRHRRRLPVVQALEDRLGQLLRPRRGEQGRGGGGRGGDQGDAKGEPRGAGLKMIRIYCDETL